MRILGDTPGWWTALVVVVVVGITAQAQVVPKLYDSDAYPNSLHYSNNDVYPTHYIRPTVSDLPNLPTFSKARVINMTQTTDLREYVMKYVKDPRICSSKYLRELILGKEETDRRAKIWWSRRCEGRRGSPINIPTKLSEKSTNDKRMKKLQSLLKNKKIQCNAKKAVVELPNTDPNTVTFKPSCVYIKQCGGCCDSPLLQCQPTKTRKKTFWVLAISKDTSAIASNNMLRKVTVNEHQKCKCECKVSEADCTENQQYNSDACSCYCPPQSRKTCSSGKVWDEKKCDCVCSDVSECTTGRFFDTDTCRCADPPV